MVETIMAFPTRDTRLAECRAEEMRGADAALTIAIINNMPDPALRATERHFCSLLSAASAGMRVELKFYTMPGVPRGDAIRGHLDACYEDFATLMDRRPDGLIVTGAEPKCPTLTDEAFWAPLAELVDWAVDDGVPAIWSCLAAHAAVLRMDGVERRRLNRKLSGVFECQVGWSWHQVLHGVPRRWRIPHSRLHGLPRKALEANGYSILSGSRDVGVDMFIKQGAALQLFLQGHPEYSPGTLLAEYRRDVIRAARAERTDVPDVPYGVGGKAERVKWGRVADLVKRHGAADSLALLDTMIATASPEDYWSPIARTILRNWLSYLDARRLTARVPLSLAAMRGERAASALSP
jgi:homoserine O-succinyltransferase